MSTPVSHLDTNANAIAFDMCNLVLRHAVDRLANWKCAQAIKAGKLRIVPPCAVASAPKTFTPRMDLIDDAANNTLVAVIELPGVHAGDVALELQKGSLIIKGERLPPLAVRQRLAVRDTVPDDTQPGAPPIAIHIHEIRFGKFYRAIPVRAGLKESDITAALQAGTLTITWPRVPPVTSPRGKQNIGASPSSRRTPGMSH